MSAKPFNILFLCTGNSARSILAEGLATKLGEGRFRGFSAGSQASGRVNPLALETLVAMGCDTAGMRSKNWDEFAEPGAPKMDFIITVCDNAAGETCPVWPGMPMTAHWGFADPSHVEGDDAARLLAFERTAHAIAHRLRLFMSLPMEALERESLLAKLRAIGQV